MFGIRRTTRQPEQPGETRWRIICDGPVGKREPAEYTHWRSGRPVIYPTQADAEWQASKLRDVNPGMTVYTEPTTDPVPPPLGSVARDCASYTPLRLIPLNRQIAQILDR
jgi:hypothetical protein